MTVTFEILRNEPEHAAYPAGATIFAAGDPSQGMYVVLEGAVDILTGDHVLESVPAGGVFRELALIDAGPRGAGARVRTDCRVALIDEKRFKTLVQRTPHFALQMLRLLAEGLRRRPNG